MREILFRGKRKDNGEWAYGSLFAEYKRVEITRGTCNNVGIEGVDVIPETVGQYTGLTDKNGKKIFEGDILNCSSFSGINDFKNCAVKWCDLFLSFRSDKHSLSGDFRQDYEVIGNIHDNPELIESGDNK